MAQEITKPETKKDAPEKEVQKEVSEKIALPKELPKEPYASQPSPIIASPATEAPPNALYEFRLKQLEEQVDQHQESVVGYAKDVQGIASGYVGDFINSITLIVALLGVFTILVGMVTWFCGLGMVKRYVKNKVHEFFDERVKEKLDERFKQYDEDIAEIREEAELAMRLFTLKPDDKIKELQGYMVKLQSKLSLAATAEKQKHFTAKIAEYYFYLGNNFSETNTYDQAIVAYTQSITLDPNNAATYYNRGNTYFEKTEHERAINDYDKAIALDPNDAATYYNRGVAYDEKGDHEQAIKDYDKAIALDPNHAKAYVNRGVIYTEKGDHKRAIIEYDRAIALNPNHAKAYYNLGNVYFKKGEYEQAIKDYDKAIALDPNDAKAYGNRGGAYVEKGDHEQAIKDYDKAIALDPNFANAHYNLACLYTVKQPRDEAAAMKHVRKAIALDSKNKEIAKKDEDFTALHNNPEFRALVGMDE